MTEKMCRSKSPEPADNLARVPCAKPRGHKGRRHSNPLLSRKWEGGINTTPVWEFIDDGYMTEADWMTWGRL